MAKGLTPIERHIAGVPQDRRRRHERKMLEGGFVYVRLLVPANQVDRMRELARELRDSAASDGSRTSDHD